MMQETTEIEFLRKSAMNEDDYVFNVFYDFMFKPRLSLLQFKDFVLKYFAEAKRNIILDSINQILIIKVSIKSPSRKDSLAKAVYQLHHENQLGLKYISGILKINEIDISVNDLMVYSQQHFEKCPLPNWAKSIINDNEPLKNSWGKFRILTDEEKAKASKRRNNNYFRTPKGRQKQREYAKRRYDSMTPEQKKENYLKYVKPYSEKNKDKINERLRLLTRIKRCHIVDLEQLAIKTEKNNRVILGWSA